MGTIEKVPEPTGPPEAALEPGCSGSAKGAGSSLGRTLVRLGGVGAVLAVAGGVVYMVASGSTMRHTSGATRSTQLIWQRRQAEVEQAVAEAEGPGAGGAASPARGVE